MIQAREGGGGGAAGLPGLLTCLAVMSASHEPASGADCTHRTKNCIARPAVLGAHVSMAGGIDKAPARATEIGASVFQIFTKQPNRWAEPFLEDDAAAAFRTERARTGAAFAVSHDSYLINLASPQPVLWRRSADCSAGNWSEPPSLAWTRSSPTPETPRTGTGAAGSSATRSGSPRRWKPWPVGRGSCWS